MTAHDPAAGGWRFEPLDVFAKWAEALVGRMWDSRAELGSDIALALAVR